MERRKFIETTVYTVAGMSLPGIAMAGKRIKPIRFGIVTDVHYAEAPDNVALNRYFSQSLEKMREFTDLMNEQEVDFIIELGDLKDQGNPPKEADTLFFLKTIEKELQKFKGPVYHVLGNHDHDSISKLQFLELISNDGFFNALNYYSFTRNGIHFIVLDANYSSDGAEYDHGNFDWTDARIPDDQLKWLKKDLRLHKKPTIVFIHHQLDSPAIADKRHCPKNAEKSKIIGVWEILPKINISGIGFYAGKYSMENMLWDKGIGLIDCAIIYTTIESKSLLWTLDKKILRFSDEKYLYK